MAKAALLLAVSASNSGKRKFIQLLRLMEALPRGRCGWRDAAIDRGAIGFDAVKHLVLCSNRQQIARCWTDQF